MKEIGRKDIEEIITKYGLGTLRGFKIINRRISTLNLSFIIDTSKGKFFLKVYVKEVDKFRYHILKGLDLLIFLEKKKYPSVRVKLTKDKKPYLIYNGILFAIFEFIDLEEKSIENKEQAYELGKYLGSLHVLAKKFAITKTGQGYDSFKKDLKENFYISKDAPQKYKNILNYIKKYYPKLKASPSSPKSVCHVEFSSQHVRFDGDKLIKVIDWDEVSKDYMFYDLGTSMADCFVAGKINFDILKNILSGYESQRKLTEWEKKHLFEALFFGISKHVIWGLNKEEIEKSGWDKIGLQEVGALIDIGKDKFYGELLK